MILCRIILIVGAVMAIAGGVILFVMRNVLHWSPVKDVITPILIMLGSVAMLIAGLLLIILPIEANQELNAFICQKEYIEDYEPTSEYDAAAILSKKIELNEWLYEKQYVRENRPICSFYGDEILKLEPIK